MTYIKTIKCALITFFIIFSMLLNAEHPVSLIESLHITKNRVDVIINRDFKEQYLKDDFFVEYEQNIDLTKLDQSIVVMPFLMNVISIVWVSGKTYTIDSMDEELYSSLKKIREVFRRFYPKTPFDGELVPKKLVKNSYKDSALYEKNKDKVGFTFSGGLDSICSSLRNNNIRQVLFTLWGHNDLPLSNKQKWLNFKKEIVNFALRFGNRENVFIASNYHEFLNTSILRNLSSEIYNWRICTVEDLGWAGLVAPMLVHRGIGLFNVASTITWNCRFPKASHQIVSGNIKFADISINQDSFDLARDEKCAYITDFCKKNKIPKLFIGVCPETRYEKLLGNCSRCFKCRRTMAGFLLAGENPQKFGFKHNNPDIIFKGWSKTLKPTIIFELDCLQRNIKKKLAKGEYVDSRFLPLLSIDIRQRYEASLSIHPQKLINLNDFKDLYGHIPDIYCKNP
jgi:hypothetical protein